MEFSATSRPAARNKKTIHVPRDRLVLIDVHCVRVQLVGAVLVWAREMCPEATDEELLRLCATHVPGIWKNRRLLISFDKDFSSDHLRQVKQQYPEVCVVDVNQIPKWQRKKWGIKTTNPSLASGREKATVIRNIYNHWVQTGKVL